MASEIVPQSGVIPYRVRGGQLEVALVTMRSRPGWTIPKGHIEPNLSAPASAAKEALEEAGLIGRTHRQRVGTYTYEKNGTLKHVSVYAMHVRRMNSCWAEMHQRRRQWFTVAEAAGRVRSAELRCCIQRLTRRRPRR